MAPRPLRPALCAALLCAAALAGCADGDGPSATSSWRVDFSGRDDGAGFSNPDGTDTGNCLREVRDGAAVYRWAGPAPDGEFTRCYPTHHFSVLRSGQWRGAVPAPWTLRGRFRVTLPDPRAVAGGETLSLITVLPTPPADTAEGRDLLRWRSSTTVNVIWSRALGAPALNVFHVPGQGEGVFRQVVARPFPLGRWVDIRLEWDAANRVRLYQDDRLVITARKEAFVDAGGAVAPLEEARLHAVHFGGYASAAVTGWTVENDDLEVVARA